MKIVHAVLALVAATILCASTQPLIPFAAVGSQVDSSYRMSGLPRGLCTATDCELLMQDGSRWTIFGSTVTRQRYFRAEAGGRLPFGLASIAGRQQSLETVRAFTGVELTPSATRRVHEGLIKLEDGTDAILYVRLDSKGAVEEIGVTLGESG